MKTVPFKIKRQFGPDLDPYWENFEIPHSPNSNVISYLMDIRKNPVNADGIKVPLVWDCSCLEEVWNLYHENQRTGQTVLFCIGGQTQVGYCTRTDVQVSSESRSVCRQVQNVRCTEEGAGMGSCRWIS